MKDTATYIIVTAVLRQLLLVGIGAMQVFVNAHPNVFGVRVEWIEDAKLISDIAAGLAFLILSWVGTRSRLKMRTHIKSLETKLVNAGVEP